MLVSKRGSIKLFLGEQKREDSLIKFWPYSVSSPLGRATFHNNKWYTLFHFTHINYRCIIPKEGKSSSNAGEHYFTIQDLMQMIYCSKAQVAGQHISKPPILYTASFNRGGMRSQHMDAKTITILVWAILLD